MICSKPPLNSDLLIFLDQFPPKNCRWLRTLFSHSTRLLILWRGLILTGYFQSKACPKASHTKPMLLTSSWCSHENMNQEFSVWDMQIQAPSRALNGAAEDPAQADTRAWRELPCVVLRSHSRIVTLPSLGCPTLYCLWPRLSHKTPTKAQFNISGPSWKLYIVLKQNTVSISVTRITGNKTCFKQHLDKLKCILQGWSKEQSFNFW